MATSQLVLPTATRRQLLVGATAVAATGLTAARASAGVPSAGPAAAPGAPAYLASRKPHGDQSARVHTLGRGHLAQPGGDDRPEDRPARRQHLGGTRPPVTASGYTSPTNIGGYLWSAVVARELGIISKGECTKRLTRTLNTLLRMEHHEPSGMYYNWYDEATGAKLTTWPTDGSRVDPFLSSVDNGWLGAALKVVRLGRPRCRPARQPTVQADALGQLLRHRRARGSPA